MVFSREAGVGTPRTREKFSYPEIFFILAKFGGSRAGSGRVYEPIIMKLPLLKSENNYHSHLCCKNLSRTLKNVSVLLRDDFI